MIYKDIFRSFKVCYTLNLIRNDLGMAKNTDLLLKNVIFRPHHESGFFSGGFENQEFQNWHLCSMRVRSRSPWPVCGVSAGN